MRVLIVYWRELWVGCAHHLHGTALITRIFTITHHILFSLIWVQHWRLLRLRHKWWFNISLLWFIGKYFIFELVMILHYSNHIALHLLEEDLVDVLLWNLVLRHFFNLQPIVVHSALVRPLISFYLLLQVGYLFLIFIDHF